MRKRGILLILIIVLSSSVLALTGDFDENGKVEFNDFLMFAEAFRNFNEGDIYNEVFDLNRIGESKDKIDVADFFLFAENYGKDTGVSKSATKKSDYYWDIEAVRNLDESICDNIQDLQLRDFCKYRVRLFSGSLSQILTMYHVDVERSSDMELDKMLNDYDTEEFSLLEYDAISGRDSDVVYSERNEAILFIIEAPEGQNYGSLSLSGYVYLYDRSDFGALIRENFNLDENVFVLTPNGYVEFGDHKERTSDVFKKNVIPVIEGKISFVFNDFYDRVVIDQAFSGIQFAEGEGDFSRVSKIWGRSELKPNGGFESL
tara:strand:- start:307 stop:1257 length:951 start_codon:yes stop_codon:yes gene_type:complete